MTVKFSNGTTIEAIMVTGASRYTNGFNRDALTFVLDESLGLDAVDKMFTEAACESITLINDTEEYIHTGYTIRVELNKHNEVVTAATSEAEEETVTRIFVTMAQRTYSESKLQALSDAVELLSM